MSKKILIIGQVPDPHISSVAAALARSGARTLIFSRLQPQNYRFNYHLTSDGCKGFLYLEGERCDLAKVSAVWWRVKPFTVTEISGQTPSIVDGFIEREWRSALDSLETFTSQALWVNPRAADLRARNKPVQLAVAQDLGFVIPQTLVSNDAEEIASFLEARGKEYIYKVLTWYIEPPDRMIFTSIVDAEQVKSDPEAVSITTGMFQERMPKAFEIRATVIGNKVFAVRIDSQAHEETKLDWRRSQHLLSYSPYELPDDIIDLLVAMNHRLGLFYGAYDLIVTPSEQYVFLEVNPLGQWLWLENATGIQISQTLAEFLLRQNDDI